ncbi:hypothetical protein AR456_18430 [Halomonas huangheensis]|nr:hypothetical protein AR456_18430 [Halomonas huangheensis]
MTDSSTISMPGSSLHRPLLISTLDRPVAVHLAVGVELFAVGDSLLTACRREVRERRRKIACSTPPALFCGNRKTGLRKEDQLPGG